MSNRKIINIYRICELSPCKHTYAAVRVYICPWYPSNAILYKNKTKQRERERERERGERERERERETDRQTDRQTDIRPAAEGEGVG